MSMLTSGSGGHGGITGHQGTITADYLTKQKSIQKKYHNRFTITTEYDIDGITNTIIDNRTNKQYKIKHTTNQSNIVNETEQFILGLIIRIRDEKISQVINGH